MIQLILVSLPAAWLAACLGVLFQRALPLLPFEWFAWGVANAGLLAKLGPALVAIGFLLLLLELLRGQTGVVLDSLLMLLGGVFWLTGSLLHPSPYWGWLAQPLFVIMLTPALASMVVLNILNGEDSIDASLLIAGMFTIGAALLHALLWGLPW